MVSLVKEELNFNLILLFIKYFKVNAIDWLDNENDGDGFWAFYCNFETLTIGSVRVVGEDCGRKCLDKPGCTNFVWIRSSQICLLKTGLVSEGSAIPSNSHDMCGFFRSRGKYHLKLFCN